MRAIRESPVQALANLYHVGGAYRRVRDAARYECAALGVHPCCVCTHTTLFVGNGLYAVPFALRGAWGRHAGRPLLPCNNQNVTSVSSLLLRLPLMREALA